tara:strand:- start:622 stop:864 length:243 start_codon:yes stop_codon:yes gene_type:complete
MDNIDNDKIKEQIEEELYEDGLRGKKLERAVDKRFLQEVKVKQKPIRNIKIKNQKRKTIRAKQGGSIGNKFVASIYGGCN